MRTSVLAAITLLAAAGQATASDACSTTWIEATADVTVSDGSSFSTESFYQSADNAAIRHIREDTQLIAVEGPVGWWRRDGSGQTGSNLHRSFALGHQFHALLLHFDDIMDNVRAGDAIPFGDTASSGKSGDYPFGGTVHLVNGDERPAGMVFEFPDHKAMIIRYSEWRTHDGAELPFRVTVDDGTRVFDYRFTDVELDARPPGAFAEAIGAPGLENVEVYRLHRELLAAHCAGDYERMAALSTPEIVNASRGHLGSTTRDEMREGFRGLFESVDYTSYHDLADPVIEVSESGDLGWIAVEVRAQGTVTASGAPFDDQWAWVMLVRKVDGQWLHAGNASNLAEPTQ